MEQEKKLIHEVYEVHVQGTEHDMWYRCAVCKHTTKNKEEFNGECGGLPPLGFGVGDKAPQIDVFGPKKPKPQS